MRVLIVGASPDPHAYASLIDLAAVTDMVIACDGGVDRCVDAGVVPDLVVGDFDSTDGVHLRTLPPEHVLTYPVDKDHTDLELALSEARTRCATSIIATGIVGGRFDHALAALGALASAADLGPVIRWQTGKCSVLCGSGVSTAVVKGDETPFSLIALGDGARVTCVGARFPLTDARLAPLAGLGVSNVVEGDQAHVTIHSGTVLLVVDAYTH